MIVDSSSLPFSTELVLSRPFIDSIPNGILVCDTEFKIIQANRWITQKLGLTPDDLTNKPLQEAFPELAQRNLIEAYRLVIQTSMPLSLSNRIHRYFIKMPAVSSYAKLFPEMPQSVVITPLVKDNQLIGTLTTIFDVTERLMTERATQHEIDKLNALHDVDRAIATLDIEKCLQTIVRNTLELFGAKAAALFLYESDELKIACQIPETPPLPTNQALFASLLETQQPVTFSAEDRRISSIDGSRKVEMAAPLIVDHSCIGVLDVQALRHYEYTEEELNLLNSLASRAAVAIHNARLHKTEKVQRELLESLRDISISLVSELKIDTVLDTLLASVERVLPYDSAQILLVAGNLCRIVRQRGDDFMGDGDQVNTTLFSIDDFPYLRQMAKTHRPSIIANTAAGAHWRSADWLGHAGSCAGAPIIVRGSLLGFLTMEKKAPSSYSEDITELLVSFTTLAGMALENARLYEEQKKLAVIDGLTGISNRRAMDEELSREIERGKRMHHDTSLLMIDIDHFKHYNDTYGHLVGDLVLIQLAALLKKNLRRIDILGRFGGEEFMVILPETDLIGAAVVAETLRHKVTQMNRERPLPETELPDQMVTISIGVSSAPVHAQSPADLIHAADQALYQAKRTGRNKVCIHESMARIEQILTY